MSAMRGMSSSSSQLFVPTDEAPSSAAAAADNPFPRDLSQIVGSPAEDDNLQPSNSDMGHESALFGGLFSSQDSGPKSPDSPPEPAIAEAAGQKPKQNSLLTLQDQPQGQAQAKIPTKPAKRLPKTSPEGTIKKIGKAARPKAQPALPDTVSISSASSSTSSSSSTSD